MEVCCDALGVSLSKTAPGADLGGSNKYSNESFEDRSGAAVGSKQDSDCLFCVPSTDVSFGPSLVAKK